VASARIGTCEVEVDVRIVTNDGVQTLECTHEEASILSSLLCVARPRGEAEFGRLRVAVFGEAAMAGTHHVPVDPR